MSAEKNDRNPYAPPSLPSPDDVERSLPPLPENRWNELDVRVEAVDRGWWTRRIWLAGSITAELFYDPSGHGERVYVNGQLLATTSFWQFAGNVAPHIDFHLHTDQHAVPASINVAASMLRLLRLAKFELIVAGRTVYEE